MTKLFLGKINLSKIDKTKLFDGKTGVWMDITVWFNEEPDQYGNNLSIQQSTKKEENNIYLGEAKFYKPKNENKEGVYQKSGKVDVTSMSDPADLEDPLANLPF